MEELYNDIPWKSEAPMLQIMDSATWDTLQALTKTGMISIHTRAKRSLLAEDGDSLPPPLTPEELAASRPCAKRLRKNTAPPKP